MQAPGGSSIGAMGELLYLILAVWFLTVPLFLTLLCTAGKGRSMVWPFAGTAAGAFAFVLVRELVAPLDVVVGALIPIAAGSLTSLSFALAVHRLPPVNRGRRWQGHLLDSGGGVACTLSVDGDALSLRTAGAHLQVPRIQVTEVSRDS
jgi:hypothetical protein